MTLSSIAYPTDVYGNYLANTHQVKRHFEPSTNITQNDLRKKILGLSIYYDELGYTKITETPQFELSGLISNMGGNFFLYMFYLFFLI